MPDETLDRLIEKEESSAKSVSRATIICATVASNLANVFAGGYMAAMNAQGFDSKMEVIYPSLLASNLMTGSLAGYLCTENSAAKGFVRGGVASPFEFGIGYAFVYYGTKIFS
jgi:hypothetical protein